MNEKVCLINLGCAKNRVDGEIILAKLKLAKFCIVQDPQFADVVIVNTCGFIEDAKKESIEEILDMARLKFEGKIKAVIVIGCLAERYQHQVAEQLTEVDGVIGIGSNKDIVGAVKSILKGNRVELYGKKEDLPLNADRFLDRNSFSSYLKIAEGCDNHCSYCAIPMIRGKFRSRRMEDIIKEANKLVKMGIKELIIVAQDTTRYGQDIYGEFSLAKLLLKLCKIKDLKWIRLLYCYPDKITDELINVIASQDKILKYIDIPMQHCNDRILKKMNRTGNKAQLMDVINKLREKVDGIVIRTSMMVGFPSETEEEFEELTLFCKEIKFDRMGCFAYSQEEDTKAATFDDQIENTVKLRRQEIMMEDQMKIMENKAKACIGEELVVLIEGDNKKENLYFGRSYKDAPEVDCKVYFRSKNKQFNNGDFVKVKVTKNIECDLVGEIIE